MRTRRSTYIRTLLTGCIVVAVLCQVGCDNKPEEKPARKKIDYIRPIPGTNDSISAAIAQKGEVLIGYSDCYTCHKKHQRAKGPAFEDIAKRYPVNQVYIEMLARKVILGGNRNWGYPVMDPHPNLSFEDAKTMVTYILSMKKNVLLY